LYLINTKTSSYCAAILKTTAKKETALTILLELYEHHPPLEDPQRVSPV
jgi:hypothetical protein